jgi:hypothetical protein
MDNPQKTAPRKDNRLFGQELEKRTLNFGVRIIKLSYRLPRTLEGGVVRAKTTKAGTPIGANYREANRAKSRADFKNKIKICMGKPRDPVLAGVDHGEWMAPRNQIEPEFNEAKALLTLFGSVAKNS